MKHLWTIACQQAIINNETKTISLMDVLESITFKPATRLINGRTLLPFKFEIVSYWIRENDSEKAVEYLLEAIDPDGRKIIEKNYKMDFPGNGKNKMRSIIKSNAFIFTTEGQYLFQIKMKKYGEYKTVAKIPVEIKLKKSQETK